METHAIGCFSITAKGTMTQGDNSFWLTTVYGPADDARKDDFLANMVQAAPPVGEPWMINGDFNMIYQARDKSNSNINRRMIGKFHLAIDLAGLKEVKCKNRRFTWSNERERPTMCSIDKVFCNFEWDNLFPNYMLKAAATVCSTTLLSYWQTRLHQRANLHSNLNPFGSSSLTSTKLWPEPGRGL